MMLKISTPLSVRYWEFPELLFGKSVSGEIFFDATHYIAQKGDAGKHSPVDFIRRFSFWLEAVRDSYETTDLIATDEATGNILIDESLALLFVAYVDSGFAVYILERVSELLLDGIVLSDTRIQELVRNRLTKSVLSNLLKEEK